MMLRPRIGIDVTSALTQGGGIGRYTRELVRALVELDTDCEYHLFAARPSAPPPVANPFPSGTHIHYHPAPLSERWLYRLWYRASLPLPVQWMTGPLDLFHSPDFVLPPVRDGIPTLLTVHDLSFAHFPDTFPAPLVAYLNKVVPWSVARATHILADSQATREDLIALWGVAPEKITVLYSGVSAAFRPIDDVPVLTKMRGRYGLGERPYLLAVGTLQPRKNYDMLIRAFARVSAQLPHDLVIAGGKGWLEEAMLDRAAQLGIGERVRFLGFVDDADLPALYSAADLLAMPSLYEGFGLPVLEGMACGTATLVSDSSSLPEVGGAAAVLLPPTAEEQWAGAILTLLSNPARRAEMRTAGLVQARKFSWQRAAEQLDQLYGALLDKPALSGHNKPTTRHNAG